MEPGGKPAVHDGEDVAVGGRDGVGAYVGGEFYQFFHEGTEVFVVEAGEEVSEGVLAGADGGHEVETVVPGGAHFPGALLVSDTKTNLENYQPSLFVKAEMKPDGEMGLEFGFGWGKDAGDEIVDAVIGAAEAENAAEVGEAHDEAAAVAPGAEEPV